MARSVANARGVIAYVVVVALSISTSSAWRSYDPQSCRGPVGVVASHDCASVPAPGLHTVRVRVHLDVATIDATADVVVASEFIPPLRSPDSRIHFSNKGFAATFDPPVGPRLSVDVSLLTSLVNARVRGSNRNITPIRIPLAVRRGRAALFDQKTIVVVGTPIEGRAETRRVARILACLTRDRARRWPIGVPLRMGCCCSARVAADDKRAIAVPWTPVERVAILSCVACLLAL